MGIEVESGGWKLDLYFRGRWAQRLGREGPTVDFKKKLETEGLKEDFGIGLGFCWLKGRKVDLLTAIGCGPSPDQFMGRPSKGG